MARKNISIFDPAHFRFEKTSPHSKSMRLYFYDGFSITWATRYLFERDAMELITSYTSEKSSSPSESEIKGFLYETCFDSELDTEAYDRKYGSKATVTHFVRQVRPEAPKFNKNTYYRFPDEDLEKLIHYDAQASVIRTLNPAQIRNTLHIPEETTDRDLIIQSHRLITTAPFFRTSEKIQSAQWLHNHGLTVTVPHGI